MERPLMLMKQENLLVAKLAVYRFNAILTKIPMIFFPIEAENNLNSQETQKTPDSQRNLDQKEHC